MPALIEVSDVTATATTERLDDVKKKLVSKMKVIAKRTDAVQAFTTEALKVHNDKVAAFTAAVEAATTPEQIETAIESKDFSFNERFYTYLETKLS